MLVAHTKPADVFIYYIYVHIYECVIVVVTMQSSGAALGNNKKKHARKRDREGREYTQ